MVATHGDLGGADERNIGVGDAVDLRLGPSRRGSLDTIEDFVSGEVRCDHRDESSRAHLLGGKGCQRLLQQDGFAFEEVEIAPR